MQFEFNFRSDFAMGGVLQFPGYATGTDRDNCQSHLKTQHRDQGGSYTQGALVLKSTPAPLAQLLTTFNVLL